MCRQSEIKDLQELLFDWLDAAWNEYNSGNKTDFLLGKIYAYIECLEKVFDLDGAEYDESLALESMYGIR